MIITLKPPLAPPDLIRRKIILNTFTASLRGNSYRDAHASGDAGASQDAFPCRAWERGMACNAYSQAPLGNTWRNSSALSGFGKQSLGIRKNISIQEYPHFSLPMANNF